MNDMSRGLAILGILTVGIFALVTSVSLMLVNPEERLFEYTSFEIEPAFPGLSFNNPVGIYHDNDNTEKLFVVEQRGVIYVVNKSDPNFTKSVFIDIGDQVLYGGEQGLLGLAFHPNFSINGYFYLDYTTDNPRRTVISRFSIDTSDPNLGNQSSELVLLEVHQPYPNHNGGQLAFGPQDGYLYVALGDGGSGGDPLNHAQNRSTLLGSIIRINVDNPQSGLNYGVPSDNPFVDNLDGYREEIFAYGLRNPWRFSFDPFTGWLWAADVGQNRIEEIDIIDKGQNYGWRIMEGTQCYNPSSGCNTAGLTLPIYEYDHSVGNSITGGVVYRGTELSSLIGFYIYADYGSGDIWALNYNDSVAENYLLKDTNLNIVSFGVDQENELFICAFDSKIHKLVEILTTSNSTSIEQPTEPTTLNQNNSTNSSSNTIQDIPIWVSIIAILIITGYVGKKRKKI